MEATDALKFSAYSIMIFMLYGCVRRILALELEMSLTAQTVTESGRVPVSTNVPMGKYEESRDVRFDNSIKERYGFTDCRATASRFQEGERSARITSHPTS